MAIAYVVDCLARVRVTIRIDGDVYHAQVNAQYAPAWNRFGFFDVTRGRQVKLVSEKRSDRIRLAVLSRVRVACRRRQTEF